MTAHSGVQIGAVLAGRYRIDRVLGQGGMGTVMGTLEYMSPEQMRSSRDVDHRSDIWSLGVVLYELLQGAPPFGGDTFSSMVLKVVNDPLPKLTVALPGDLASVIYRCLEKDPARRFQNVAELAHTLGTYAHSEPQAAISVQRTRSIVKTEPPFTVGHDRVGSSTAPGHNTSAELGGDNATRTGCAAKQTTASPRHYDANSTVADRRFTRV